MHVLFCIFFKHRFTQLILILPNRALYFFPTSTNITSLTKTTYSSANFSFFKWSLTANQKFNYQLPINSAVQSSIPLCQVQIKWLLYLLMPTLLWILFWFCLTVPSSFQDTIHIPAFYHQQWQLDYPEFVQFKYDEATYEI